MSQSWRVLSCKLITSIWERTVSYINRNFYWSIDIFRWHFIYREGRGDTVHLTLYNAHPYTRIHISTSKDLVHRIFHFFKFDNAFTHTPFLLPASFCHILINKASLPSSRQDTKTHCKIFVPKHRCCNSSSWRNPNFHMFLSLLIYSFWFIFIFCIFY